MRNCFNVPQPRWVLATLSPLHLRQRQHELPLLQLQPTLAGVEAPMAELRRE